MQSACMHKPYIILLIYNLKPILYCRSSSELSKIRNCWVGLPMPPSSPHAFKWTDILLWEVKRVQWEHCLQGTVPAFFIVRRCQERVSSWLRQMDDATEPDSLFLSPVCPGETSRLLSQTFLKVMLNVWSLLWGSRLEFYGCGLQKGRDIKL